MATHSSVLAWRIPGTGEPGGLPSLGSHRVGHDWSDLAAVAAAVAIFCLPQDRQPTVMNHRYHLSFKTPSPHLVPPRQGWGSRERRLNALIHGGLICCVTLRVFFFFLFNVGLSLYNLSRCRADIQYIPALAGKGRYKQLPRGWAVSQAPESPDSTPSPLVTRPSSSWV